MAWKSSTKTSLSGLEAINDCLEKGLNKKDDAAVILSRIQEIIKNSTDTTVETQPKTKDDDSGVTDIQFSNMPSISSFEVLLDQVAPTNVKIKYYSQVDVDLSLLNVSDSLTIDTFVDPKLKHYTGAPKVPIAMKIKKESNESKNDKTNDLGGAKVPKKETIGNFEILHWLLLASNSLLRKAHKIDNFGKSFLKQVQERWKCNGMGSGHVAGYPLNENILSKIEGIMDDYFAMMKQLDNEDKKSMQEIQVYNETKAAKEAEQKAEKIAEIKAAKKAKKAKKELGKQIAGDLWIESDDDDDNDNESDDSSRYIRDDIIYVHVSDREIGMENPSEDTVYAKSVKLAMFVFCSKDKIEQLSFLKGNKFTSNKIDIKSIKQRMDEFIKPILLKLGCFDHICLMIDDYFDVEKAKDQSKLLQVVSIEFIKFYEYWNSIDENEDDEQNLKEHFLLALKRVSPRDHGLVKYCQYKQKRWMQHFAIIISNDSWYTENRVQMEEALKMVQDEYKDVDPLFSLLNKYRIPHSKKIETILIKHSNYLNNMMIIFSNHFNSKEKRQLYQQCGNTANIIDIFKQTYDWCKHTDANVDGIKNSCTKSNFDILRQLTNGMNQESVEHILSNLMNDKDKQDKVTEELLKLTDKLNEKIDLSVFSAIYLLQVGIVGDIVQRLKQTDGTNSSSNDYVDMMNVLNKYFDLGLVDPFIATGGKFLYHICIQENHLQVFEMLLKIDNDIDKYLTSSQVAYFVCGCCILKPLFLCWVAWVKPLFWFVCLVGFLDTVDNGNETWTLEICQTMFIASNG